MVMNKCKKAYLAFGANLGDRERNIREAIELIDENGLCCVKAVSSLYLTKPVGPQDQPDYYNAVAEIATRLTPRELLVLCNSIEEKLGRKRTIRWGPRVIDIDILFYNYERITEPDLEIPHPRIMERAFVLVPLAEIAPDLEISAGIKVKDAVERVRTEDVKIINKD